MITPICSSDTGRARETAEGLWAPRLIVEDVAHKPPRGRARSDLADDTRTGVADVWKASSIFARMC
jgi:hypothetical protein